MRHTRLAPFLIGSLVVHGTLLLPANFSSTVPGAGSTLAVTLFTSRANAVADSGSTPSPPRRQRPLAETGESRSRPATGAVGLQTAADETQPGSPAAGQTGARLTHALLDALGPHFSYPLAARLRGWQGEVQIAVRIAADGKLDAIRLARSSGHSILDQAALLSLARIGRLPQAGEWLQGRSFDLQVPVVYRLTRG